MRPHPELNSFLDGLTFAAVIGIVMQILPPLTAALTLIWTLIRLYETKTVQDWLARRKQRRK